jgi:hypothetical protein
LCEILGLKNMLFRRLVKNFVLSILVRRNYIGPSRG